ncbi:hypothetical protein [Streptomyces griseorubiginosus]|uniref:hypothetical protein n=1 Tax=Streptomyces griseorubiginosus TaxID=67304 RepID=UPI0036EFD053
MTATGYVSTSGDTRKVNKAGDTLTGDLVLVDSSPDTDRSAASKEYVLAQVAAAGTGVVRTTGDQVINGEKTFNDAIPVGPGFDPAFDNQLTRKAYVDAVVAEAGGGTAIRTAEVRITTGNVALATSVPWAIVASGATPLQCSIAAAVGDRIHVAPSFMRTGSGFFVDMAVLTSAGAISRYLGSGTSTPLAEGNPAYYPQSGSFPAATGPVQVVVQAGEVDGSGNVTLALVYQGSGTETIYAGTAYPFYLLLTNLGAQPS